MKGLATVAMLAMVIMAVVRVHPTEAISCTELTIMLLPCMDYLTSGGTPSPSANCCNGVKSVQRAIQSQADRQTACRCAKSAAGQMQVRAGAVSDLPGKCGIPTTIPIDPNTDCDTVP